MRDRCPYLLAVALFLLIPATAFSTPKKLPPPAQPPAQLITLGHSASPLTGPWKFSPGDSPWLADSSSGSSPVWAQPDFDDSGWTTMDLSPQSNPLDLTPNPGNPLPGWTAKGFPNLTGYAWYRLHVRIANPAHPLALKMPSDFEDAYQVFANGQYVGQFGSFDSSPPAVYWPRPAVFSLPPPGPRGDIEIALRFYVSNLIPTNASPIGGMHQPPIIGSPLTLNLLVSAQNTQFLFGRFGQFLAILFFLILAPVAFWLWLQNRHELAFFWLFINLISTILYDVLNWIALSTSSIPRDTASFLLYGALGSAWIPGWTMLWWYWFGLTEKRWIPWTAWLLAAADLVIQIFVLSPFGVLGSLSVTTRQQFFDASIAGLLAVCILLLVVLVQGFRRDRTEGLLAAVPILLLESAALFSYFTVIFNLPYPALHYFGLTIDVSSISSILLALAISALALRRFLRNRVRQELAHQTLELDLAQARELQQHVLIPEDINSPSFSVEVQYHPAQTVGGDFFQTVLNTDGRLLIVVGDVSGKGISAAMLVAVLVGSARTRAGESFDPASMLAVLNQRLIGRSGGHFATCLAAELYPDGRLRIANAGHLSPYLNGAEMSLTGSLPIGLAAKLEPSVQAFQLRPGDQLTFITDGVVEARNPEGELFGFDRARILCNEPVATIVSRAQQFGQNDDITVLRVVYTAGRRESFASVQI